MKPLYVLPLVLALIYGGAAAQEAPGDPKVEGRAAISAEDCVRLTNHVPDADVEYRPGADDVVPADISPVPPIEVPRDFSIYIGVDADRRLRFPHAGGPGHRTPPNLYRSYVDVGRVDYLNGQLFFNGQPLTPPEEAQVRYLCTNALRR
jgi:hypothetical protein